MARYIPAVLAPVTLLAAGAFAAQRINGKLNKTDTDYDAAKDSLVPCKPNKEIIRRVVKGEITPTPADYSAAELAVETLLQDRTIRIMKGTPFKEGFQTEMLALLSNDTGSERDCGMIAYLPNMYEQFLKTQSRREAVMELAFTSEYWGSVGSKVTFELTVLTNRWLEQYACWSVTGHDTAGNMISFLTSKEDCTKSGKYSGKVKRTKLSKYHSNAKLTHLNFVKVVL